MTVFSSGLPWQTTSQRSLDRECHFQSLLQTHAGKTWGCYLLSVLLPLSRYMILGDVVDICEQTHTLAFFVDTKSDWHCCFFLSGSSTAARRSSLSGKTWSTRCAGTVSDCPITILTFQTMLVSACNVDTKQCKNLNPQLEALPSPLSLMTNTLWHFHCFLSFLGGGRGVTVLIIFLFFSQFVKTILSQGHLTPLPLYVSPVFWAYDYSLRVYPVPDVIIFADKYDPFSITNTDCLCINPVRKRKKWNECIRSSPLTKKFQLRFESDIIDTLLINLSIIDLYRAHSQEVGSHLRCTTHPTEVWRTGRFCFAFCGIQYR